ncbi:nitroreductase family protein [Trichlorobacter lovleyi]|uniref:nitroreductase family protein n=1 Tax=Trichlorobacter lovleyi TaxID=313985 RepID=UPI0022401964|nr:nitroreductase family protein [Trichlorobacter lovleyi]QOX80667.1 nitroreductase family protein [Trichlorobacter lovleyi]
MWNLIRPYIRRGYRVYDGLFGFIYDSLRFVRFGGWPEDMTDPDQRMYNIIMIYHGLEKSLSYKQRNITSGWRQASLLMQLLKISNDAGQVTCHDKAAKQVLEKFISLPENVDIEKSLKIKLQLKELNFFDEANHGVKELTVADFRKGVLESPEDFFCSRYSLREFKEEVVSESLIMRAVKLALKTPSVCNRQAWCIYHTSDSEVKNMVLKYQTGNRPFGERAPNLLLITTDLKAFFAGSEHYQHWIDGGLLAMSLMYALHSLGLASCALNWSQKPVVDMKFRKHLSIKPNHTVILVLLVGFPDENNKVCVSLRRSIEEVFTTLEIKS